LDILYYSIPELKTKNHLELLPQTKTQNKARMYGAATVDFPWLLGDHDRRRGRQEGVRGWAVTMTMTTVLAGER
jgi:hypothetical protein